VSFAVDGCRRSSLKHFDSRSALVGETANRAENWSQWNIVLMNFWKTVQGRSDGSSWSDFIINIYSDNLEISLNSPG